MNDNDLLIKLVNRLEIAKAKVERQKELLEAAKQDLKYWEDFKKEIDKMLMSPIYKKLE